MKKQKDIMLKCRFFPFWADGREERWLNRMAADGYDLARVFFLFYLFRRGTPGGYRYRAEPLEYLPGSTPDRQYRYYLRDVGIERVCRSGRLAYLRLPAGREWPERDAGRVSRYARANLIPTCLFAALSGTGAVLRAITYHRIADLFFIVLWALVFVLSVRECRLLWAAWRAYHGEREENEK